MLACHPKRCAAARCWLAIRSAAQQRDVGLPSEALRSRVTLACHPKRCAAEWRWLAIRSAAQQRDVGLPSEALRSSAMLACHPKRCAAARCWLAIRSAAQQSDVGLPSEALRSSAKDGAGGRIRTVDPALMRRVLSPTELLRRSLWNWRSYYTRW